MAGWVARPAPARATNSSQVLTLTATATAMLTPMTTPVPTGTAAPAGPQSAIILPDTQAISRATVTLSTTCSSAVATPTMSGCSVVFTAHHRIETLGIINANVTGRGYSGILAGRSYGAVVACYTTGAVQGGDRVGGLVGYQNQNSAVINSSYSTASVSGASYVGGLVGRKFGNVTNSYSTGRVSGTGGNIGGLIGSSTTGSTTNSYWDTSTSTRATSGGRHGQDHQCAPEPDHLRCHQRRHLLQLERQPRRTSRQRRSVDLWRDRSVSGLEVCRHGYHRAISAPTRGSDVEP